MKRNDVEGGFAEKNMFNFGGQEMSRSFRNILFVSLAFMCFSSPAFSQLLTPPPERPQVDENGVDVMRGEVSYEVNDISIGGDGIGALSHIRYPQRSNHYSFMVANFPYLQGIKISVSVGNFSESFDGGSNSRRDSASAFANSNGGFFTRHDGLFVNFGKVLQYVLIGGNSNRGVYFADYVQQKNGVRWTYHYIEQQEPFGKIYRLQSVTSNTGYQLKYYYKSNTYIGEGYNGDWQKLIKIVAINNAVEYCDPLADTCSLTNPWNEVEYAETVTGSGTIPDPYVSTETVTGVDGGVTTYTKTYGQGGPQSLSIKKPGSAVDDITYSYGYVAKPCFLILPGSSYYCPFGGIGAGTDPNDPAVTSANMNGKITAYSYIDNRTTELWTTTRTLPDLEQDVYVTPAPSSDGSGPYSTRFTTDTNPLGQTSHYSYRIGGDVLTTELPEGNSVEFVRDSISNVTETIFHAKPGSGLADVTETRAYDGPGACCNKPTSVTDPRGNVTTYTYGSHGEVLTETGPAVNGVSPVKRYTYEQRYAWVKNAVGSYVQASTPVWVKTEERSCRTTATVNDACSGGAADEVVTTYDYGPNSGPNNLQIRGIAVTADGITHRTCYGYDIYGNRTGQTSPRADLSTCS